MLQCALCVCSQNTVFKQEMFMNFWSENPEKILHLEDIGVDVRLMLKRVLWK
jgi:hypothetical protein